ncbi:MAG: tetratricopeptide repeat protein [Hydrogenovibrio sp.]
MIRFFFSVTLLTMSTLSYSYGNGINQMALQLQAMYNINKVKAEQGDPRAQYEMGGIHESGSQPLSIAPNLNQAFYWYSKAAQNGFIKAQVKLGNFYQYGFGTAQNLDYATMWFSKAAKAGNWMGNKGLAEIYEERGNFKKAYKNWKVAAESGDQESKLRLDNLCNKKPMVCKN